MLPSISKKFRKTTFTFSNFFMEPLTSLKILSDKKGVFLRTLIISDLHPTHSHS